MGVTTGMGAATGKVLDAFKPNSGTVFSRDFFLSLVDKVLILPLDVALNSICVAATKGQVIQGLDAAKAD